MTPPAPLPQPFADIIAIDRRLGEKLVHIHDIAARRQARRFAQVFLSGPRMPNQSGPRRAAA